MTLGGAMHIISGGDHRLMRCVNRWRAPRWIRFWALLATRAGDGPLWYALGIIILIAGGPLRFQAVAAGLLASGSGIVLFRKIKKVTGRRRPCAIEPHCWATLLPPDQFSFPSGHTITAFAVSLSIGAFYPVLLPFLLFCAISIAASRVLLGMHFLSDVIAGACIGAILATLALWITL